MCAKRSPIPGCARSSPTPATRRSICRRRSSRASCAAKSTTTSAWCALPESSRSSDSFQRYPGEPLEFFKTQTLDGLHDTEAFGLYVDYGEIGVDAVDAARAGERVRAALDDLAFATLRKVLHHHEHLFRADREVHRTADRGDRIRRSGMPVGEVARDRDLKRTEDGEVEVAAADHAERIAVVEIRASGEERHRLLARIDQVLVLLAGRGLGPDAENAVFAVQDDLAPFGQKVGDQRRQADAEVDVGAFRDVARHARRHLLAVELLHQCLTILLTKIPGVTTCSGSIAPSSTVSRTCTTVHFAAAAMIGPKLRALLR